MAFRFTGYAYILITQASELELVAPPQGGLRIVTRLRWINQDSINHTPRLFIRDADPASIQAGLELVRLYPDRAVSAKDYLEDSEPVAVLNPLQSIVMTMAEEPSNPGDVDLLPAAFLAWLDTG